MSDRFRLLGGLALLAAVGCGTWLAAAAAADDNIVDTAGAAEPDWAVGPLAALHLPGLTDTSFSYLLIGFVAAYATVVVCAPRISLRWLLAGTSSLVVIFALAPPLLSSDVFGYVAYARLDVLHRLNPYEHGPIAAPHDAVLPLVFWQTQSTPYGPLFTFASLPLGWTSVATAVWILKAIAGAAMLAAITLVRRCASRLSRSPNRAVALLGANPLLLLYAAGGAHNDVLVLLGSLAAITLLAAGRDLSAGAALLATAALKLTGALAVPFALVARGTRLRIGTGLLIAAVPIAVATLVVFGGHIFDTVAAIGASRQFSVHYSGPDALGRLLGTGVTTGVRLACAAGAATVALLALAATRRGADWLTGAGWTALAAIAAIPSLVPWYIAWLLPFSALSRSRWLWAATIAATTLIAVTHLPLLGFANY